VPPLPGEDHAWSVQRARPSHLNALTQWQGQTYFLKWFFHRPLRRPARVEWENAERLRQLNIPSVLAVGWGEHPAGSFVVLEKSPGIQANHWWQRTACLKSGLDLCDVLARHAATLHDAGLCHRDLNVYHVLIDKQSGLRLIDVGRVMEIGRLRPRRWLVKDLASLTDSARREGFPDALLRRFLRQYLETSTRRWSRRGLLRRVNRKSERYRRHNLKKEARGLVP
jgi:tRNA A-37 threonylcarbamoyl transferase component Bud32